MRDLPNVLRRYAQFPCDTAEHPVKFRRLLKLRRDTFKVDGQVEPPEYESNHTTAFIRGQEDFLLNREKTDNSLIAKRIRDLRKQLGMNQEPFAAKLGLDQTTVSKWEGGKARPTPDAMVRLARFAEGVEKKFFLEEAGLQLEYLDGSPKLPEMHEKPAELERNGQPDRASARIALRQIDKEKKCSKKGLINWDPDLLVFCVEWLDGELERQRKRLPLKIYARLLTKLYERGYRAIADKSEIDIEEMSREVEAA